MTLNGVFIAASALAATIALPMAYGQTRATPTGVYVIAFRTPAHVRNSSGEVFHQAAADTRQLLTKYGVKVIEDPERRFIENESRMSVASMTTLAREAGAASLLWVEVDRPFTQWIEITLHAYDLQGTLLWGEKAGSGMGGISGGSGYRKCFEKLEKIIGARAGGPGLPVDSEDGGQRQ